MFFQLKDPKATKPTPIYLTHYCDDGKIRFSTGCSILPTKWNGGRPKDSVASARMALLERELRTYTESLRIQNKPVLVEELRKHLNETRPSQNRLKTTPERATGWEVLQTIIEDRQAGTVLNTAGKRYSPYTIRNLQHSLTVIRDTLPGADPLNLSQLDYDRLVSKLNGSGYSLNNVGSHIKNLRSLLREALKRGLTTSTAFLSFKILEEEANDIYLTIEELNKLEALPDLTEGQRLALDWFLIECYTGLRVVDTLRLSTSSISDDVIRIVTEKTDTPVYVPIHSSVKQILKRRGGFPPKLSEQKINKNIKAVALLAGITEPVLWSRTVGGSTKTEYLPKYSLISNHTGRRSFITNLLKAGVGHSEVMKLAGLRKIQTVQKYYKESEREVAERLRSHGFFNDGRRDG